MCMHLHVCLHVCALLTARLLHAACQSHFLKHARLNPDIAEGETVQASCRVSRRKDDKYSRLCAQVWLFTPHTCTKAVFRNKLNYPLQSLCLQPFLAHIQQYFWEHKATVAEGSGCGFEVFLASFFPFLAAFCFKRRKKPTNVNTSSLETYTLLCFLSHVGNNFRARLGHICITAVYAIAKHNESLQYFAITVNMWLKQVMHEH